MKRGGTRELEAPSVGIFTPTVSEGDLVGSGQTIGTLDVLGVQSELLAPEGSEGRITSRIGGGLARVPVEYGDALIVLSTASVGEASSNDATTEASGAGALTFDAPMSGRFYSRPSPQEPRFVDAGDMIAKGQTIGLLEVMKTFNRLVYQGDSLPERARIDRIVPDDGDDVVRGDALLQLSPANEG